MKKLKILELTNFSAGGCGVWARVKNESELLAERGHEVRVFSSNRIKGTEGLAPKEETLGKVKITRFPAIKMGGESFMRWNFSQEAIKFKPEVIIAHSYRHAHTTKALSLRKKLGCKVFLVTHAPFDRSETRSLHAKLSVAVYDKTIGKATLKKFDKIITIAEWENPFLKKLGVPKNKIAYISNGIKKEFFQSPEKTKQQNKIIYAGRVAPIKNLELPIKTLAKIKDKKIILELFGPAENNYLTKLKSLTKNLGLEKRVIFEIHQYNSSEQISKLDESRVFILPSKSEGMPQTLIEAMARGKIVIASDNSGSKEIIRDGKNGVLFKNNCEKDLAEKINLAISSKNEKIKTAARKSVEQFSWDKIIRKIEKLIST